MKKSILLLTGLLLISQSLYAIKPSDTSDVICSIKNKYTDETVKDIMTVYHNNGEENIIRKKLSLENDIGYLQFKIEQRCIRKMSIGILKNADFPIEKKESYDDCDRFMEIETAKYYAECLMQDGVIYNAPRNPLRNEAIPDKSADENLGTIINNYERNKNSKRFIEEIKREFGAK